MHVAPRCTRCHAAAAANRVSQAGALDTQAAFAAALAIRRRLAEKDPSNPAGDASRHSGRSLHFGEGLVVRARTTGEMKGRATGLNGLPRVAERVGLFGPLGLTP
jgi:hypothetical protein